MSLRQPCPWAIVSFYLSPEGRYIGAHTAFESYPDRSRVWVWILHLLDTLKAAKGKERDVERSKAVSMGSSEVQSRLQLKRADQQATLGVMKVSANTESPHFLRRKKGTVQRGWL